MIIAIHRCIPGRTLVLDEVGLETLFGIEGTADYLLDLTAVDIDAGAKQGHDVLLFFAR
jgi:hypothetical protein